MGLYEETVASLKLLDRFGDELVVLAKECEYAEMIEKYSVMTHFVIGEMDEIAENDLGSQLLYDLNNKVDKINHGLVEALHQTCKCRR